MTKRINLLLLLMAAWLTIALGAPPALAEVDNTTVRDVTGNRIFCAKAFNGILYSCSLLFGNDSAAAIHPLLTDTDGTLHVTVSNFLSGTATSALQANGNATLASILAQLQSPAQASTEHGDLQAIIASLAAPAVPSGAATTTGQATAHTDAGSQLTQLQSAVTALGQAVTALQSIVSAEATATGQTTAHSDAASILAKLTATPFLAGGSIGNTAFGANCTVVAGDQAFTASTVQGCTQTPTGRIRVGLSSAAANGAASSLYNDLHGGVDPSGNQQPEQMDAAKNVKVVDVNSAAALAAAQANVSSNASYTNGSAMTLGATYTPGRGLKVDCPGVSVVTYVSGGVTDTWQLGLGTTVIPYAASQVTSQTGSCTFHESN